MRVIHLGDLHLCRGPKNADRVAALDYALDDAASTPIDLWVWPGDLTDAGTTIEIRNYLIGAVSKMATFAPVIIVRGNHDYENDLAFLTRLRTKCPVYVVEREPDVVVVTNGELSLAVACIPYPSKAALVAAGTSNDEIGAVVDDAFETICMGLGAQLNDARAKGWPTLAIGHATISGAVASVGQPQIGTELEISPANLARLGDCPILFNHIHKHQLVHPAVYAGSLCRMDWGETEPKGYLDVTLAQKPTGQWGHSVAFRPIPVPPMYHVDGILTRDGFDWTVRKGPNGPKDDPPSARFRKADETGTGYLFPSEVDWTGCDVRVRASYRQAERDVLVDAEERVRKMFYGARRFEFEPIAVTDRALRAPEVVQAATLDEKLRAWAKLSGVSWSDLVDSRAARLLSANDEEALVDAIDAELRDLVGNANVME